MNDLYIIANDFSNQVDIGYDIRVIIYTLALFSVPIVSYLGFKAYKEEKRKNLKHLKFLADSAIERVRRNYVVDGDIRIIDRAIRKRVIDEEEYNLALMEQRGKRLLFDY
ncbi:MAG: hypothetical protein IIA87_01560 [Nanoarchaeota archaeon]|nr:hypothetical protein [Nanoarchaeota archaeon]